MILVIVSYIVFGLILSIIALVQEVVSERRRYKKHYEWIRHIYRMHEANRFATLEDYMNDDGDGRFFSHKQDLEQYSFQKHNWFDSLAFSFATILFGTLTWPVWTIAIFFNNKHNIV